MTNTESDLEQMRTIFTIKSEHKMIDELYEFVESTFPEPEKHNLLTAVFGTAIEIGGGEKMPKGTDIWDRTDALFTLDPKEMNTYAAVALLGITNTWKSHLPNRIEFITKCKQSWPNRPTLFDGFE